MRLCVFFSSLNLAEYELFHVCWLHASTIYMYMYDRIRMILWLMLRILQYVELHNEFCSYHTLWKFFYKYAACMCALPDKHVHVCAGSVCVYLFNYYYSYSVGSGQSGWSKRSVKT